MKPTPRGRRRAYMLIETMAAGVLVALAMMTAVKLLSWTAAERRSAERRGWASQEAANAMEKLAAIPYDRLGPGSTGAVKLSPSAVGLLPGASLTAEIGEVAEGPSLKMKRIDVVVGWRNLSGFPEAPVCLTAWVARRPSP